VSRTAVAILSTDNLLHNYKLLKEKIGSVKMMGMVKANAYGHGIRSVSLRLDSHLDMFGVASIDEALALRKVGVKSPIALMQGVFEPSELLVAATEKFHVVFHSLHQVEWLKKVLLPVPLNVWIKVDTGMGRLGFQIEEAEAVYELFLNHSSVVKPLRLISHFACADQIDHPLNASQIQKFDAFVQGKSCELSFCNSAALFNFKNCHHDWVRPGLALYGVSPFENQSAESLDLKPVMTLQTNLTSVKAMRKGDSIGYSASYQCPEDMVVGIAAFGYGDGYPRTEKDGAPVLVGGHECSIIGRVSMDMMAIDLRNAPAASIGDAVVLWGSGLPIENVAKHMGMSVYAMLTAIQNRVKFLWTSSGSQL
jgi:alanine racemase